MYMMTEKVHGSSENVVGVVDVLVRGGVAMYEGARGVPCVRLSSRWVGVIHEGDVVEVPTSDDADGHVDEVEDLVLPVPVLFRVFVDVVMLDGDVLVGILYCASLLLSFVVSREPLLETLWSTSPLLEVL